MPYEKDAVTDFVTLTEAAWPNRIGAGLALASLNVMKFGLFILFLAPLIAQAQVDFSQLEMQAIVFCDQKYHHHNFNYAQCMEGAEIALNTQEDVPIKLLEDRCRDFVIRNATYTVHESTPCLTGLHTILTLLGKTR